MSILKVIFVIIGTLIGAGFASGQEVYVFFFSFGIKGVLGITISSILIGLTIYKTLKIARHDECVLHIGGRSYKMAFDAEIKKHDVAITFHFDGKSHKHPNTKPTYYIVVE